MTPSAQLAAEATELATDVTVDTGVISQLVAGHTADQQAIAAANAQIATLEAQGVDPTVIAAIQTNLQTLEANNAAASAALAPVAAQVPNTPVTPAVPTPAAS